MRFTGVRQRLGKEAFQVDKVRGRNTTGFKRGFVNKTLVN